MDFVELCELTSYVAESQGKWIGTLMFTQFLTSYMCKVNIVQRYLHTLDFAFSYFTPFLLQSGKKYGCHEILLLFQLLPFTAFTIIDSCL